MEGRKKVEWTTPVEWISVVPVERVIETNPAI